MTSGVFENSPVLIKNGAVAGFLLARFEADYVRVLGKVIAPDARDGWTALALNLSGCEEARRHGVTRIRFDWRDDLAYTSKVSTRVGGKVVRRLGYFARCG